MRFRGWEAVVLWYFNKFMMLGRTKAAGTGIFSWCAIHFARPNVVLLLAEAIIISMVCRPSLCRICFVKRTKSIPCNWEKGQIGTWDPLICIRSVPNIVILPVHQSSPYDVLSFSMSAATSRWAPELCKRITFWPSYTDVVIAIVKILENCFAAVPNIG